MRALFVNLLLVLLLSSSCVTQEPAPPQQDSVVQSTSSDSFPLKQQVNGTTYSVFYSGDRFFGITSARPARDDKKISLCIAGAFTLLENGEIDGLYIEHGKILRAKANHHLGGGLLVLDGKISILKTNDGKRLTSSWADSVAKLNASFFQQIQLVRNDSALRFGKDKAFFQRRAIVIFKDGKTAVVESKEAILLQRFADDLAQLGAKDALYTDMGGWDEGFYRDANGVVRTMGLMRTDTRRQSNWVVME